MIALIQRVASSYVRVDGKIVGEIGKGLNILLGILKDDEVEDIEVLVKKIAHLRIFGDEKGKMNLSIKDIKGSVLVVSQFTLAGSVKKGRRPSFDNAKEPSEAKKLYEIFIKEFEKYNIKTASGVFGAMMEVGIYNDGPVTFIIDSYKLK